MKIEQQLYVAVAEAVKALYGQDIKPEQITLQKTKKDFEGHLTLVVFPLLKISRKKPEDTAKEIGQWIQQNTALIASFNAVAGFLNMVILLHSGWHCLKISMPTPSLVFKNLRKTARWL